MTYSTASVTSISVTATASATAAGKSISCAGGASAYTCIAFGLNANTIANGVAAVVTVTLSASATTAAIGINSALSASPAGVWVAVSATGGSIARTVAVTVDAVSVTPASGNGLQQSFTVNYFDAAGATDLSTVLVWFNGTSSSAVNSCQVEYSGASNMLYLLNDAGAAWLGPVTPGAAGTVQNSQCVVNGANSSVAASGNNLTLNAALSFLPAFAGAKNIYGNASSATGSTSGWTQLGTWTVTGTAQPPQTTSVTPSSGSGSSQTFSLVYTDPAGASDLSTLLALINSGLSGPGACDLTMDAVHNALYLLNDGATAWLGPVTPGVAGTVQNSQCTVNGAKSSMVASGNTVTLNVALSFQPGFAGAKNIYANASTIGGLTAGWTQLGTWTVTGAQQPPQTTSVTPSSGSGSSQTFTLVYTDPAGASDLSTLLALINSGLSGPGACDLTMDAVHSALYLLNDGATAWLGPVTPGVAGTVQNSQCTVNGANSSVVASGNTVTLKVSLSFQPGFAGAKNIYANASTIGGLTAGWTQLGTWTVTGAQQSPQTTSVAPSSGSGSSQTFTLVYTDPAGASDLSTLLALINSGLSGPGACDLTMDAVHNALYLLNDGATAWLGPVTPGVAGTVQNSQCTVNGANSSVVASGNTVTLNVSLSFQPGFAGAKNIYANASTIGGLTSGWTQLGTWTATSTAQPPQTTSVAPSSGSGTSQTFSFVYTDPAGASDLSTLLALINGGLSGPSSCDLTMDVVHHALYLLNDGATAWLGPVTPGVAGTVQNSQCTVNGANSSMVASGNTVTLNVALSFQPAFAGAKIVYANASNAAGLTSGWNRLGTWTIP